MAIEFKFQDTLIALRNDLQQLLRQKDELEKQIAATKQSVMGLLMLRDAAVEDTEPPTQPVNALAVAIAGMPDYNDMLAEALGWPAPGAKLKGLCRAVVRSSNAPLTAPQVKHEVELMGFDFSGYDSNPLSSIHTVLRRIPEIEYRKLDGKTVYEWKAVTMQQSAAILPPPPVTIKEKKGSGSV